MKNIIDIIHIIVIMVLISNVKVTEINLLKEFNNSKNKNMQLCKKFLAKDFNEKDLIPENSKFTVSFEIKNTVVELANAIRRCLTNEIEVYSFTFDSYEDIECNDEYILADFIKKQIHLLPIFQELPNNYNNIKLELNSHNKTEKQQYITTSDIRVVSGPKNAIINKNIILSIIRPGCYLRIKNIYITKGIGLEDGGKFNLLSNVTYRIMDVKPLNEEKNYTTGRSSLNSNPKHFYISYSTHRNIFKPKKVMVDCCDNLIKRLELILSDITNINNKDTQYFSDLLTLETNGEEKILNIKNEYWTLANLITKYCYLETKGNIKLVSPSIIHPTKNTCLIKIIHNQFITVITNSIITAIKDLKSVKKYF